MRIVFHVPYPLNRQATSASGIRPVKMLDAFRELGHEVWEVSGYSADRKKAIAKVDRAVKDGVRFDLVYSESSTMPTAMTDPNHLPLHPLLDLAFLARMRRHGTKVGLFYRDIYWRFDDYGQGLNPLKKQVALAAYRFDLLGYRKAVDVLYLPSLKMAPHVGIPVEMKALPPGHSMPETDPGPATGAHLLYVGGVGSHYQLLTLFEAVHQAGERGADVSLTVCTNAQQWAGAGEDYHRLATGPVTVVHESGEGLRRLYAGANIASLFIEPSEYRNFAAPVKLYEYVGEGKPVLASDDTLTGTFVAENGIGWTIPYTVDAAVETLIGLAGHPELVAEKRTALLAKREEHSWLGRARQVVEDLAPGA